MKRAQPTPRVDAHIADAAGFAHVYAAWFPSCGSSARRRRFVAARTSLSGMRFVRKSGPPDACCCTCRALKLNGADTTTQPLCLDVALAPSSPARRIE